MTRTLILLAAAAASAAAAGCGAGQARPPANPLPPLDAKAAPPAVATSGDAGALPPLPRP